MRKRFKIGLTCVFILIILVIVTLISLQFNFSDNKKVYKEIDKIDRFNYVLEDRDSILMQDVFKKLKEVLDKEDIDYELYAEYLSELFIVDLYTIDNKNNKYDVGSTEYVLDEVLENYKLNVQDTLYKYVVDYSKRSDNDIYAVVKSIEKENIDITKYKFDKIEYDAYKMILNWTYEKDLGYDTKGEVTLIKKDDKLYVVSYKGVE